MTLLLLIASLILQIACSAASTRPDTKIAVKKYDTIANLLGGIDAPLIMYSLDNTNLNFQTFQASQLGPVVVFQSSSSKDHRIANSFFKCPLGRLFLKFMTEPDWRASWELALQLDNALEVIESGDALRRAMMAAMNKFAEQAMIRKKGSTCMQQFKFRTTKIPYFKSQLTGRFLIQKKIACGIKRKRFHRPVRMPNHPPTKLMEALLLVLADQKSIHSLAFVCRDFYNATRPAAIMKMNRLAYARRVQIILSSFNPQGGLPFFIYKLLSCPNYLNFKALHRLELLTFCFKSLRGTNHKILALLNTCKDAEFVAQIIEQLHKEAGLKKAIQATAFLSTSSYRFKHIYALLHRLFSFDAELRTRLEGIRKYASIIHHGGSINENTLFGLSGELFASIHNRIIALST